MRSAASRAVDQSGAYAVEFAWVFVICFLILYALLTYGLIFMAQQSLNRTANSGARMLLAWARDDSERVCRVRAAADRQLSWIRSMAGDERVEIAVCLPAGRVSDGSSGLCSADNDPSGLCPADAAAHAASSQQAEVIVRYDYRKGPLLPILGAGSLLSIPVPDVLQARASVDLAVSYPGAQEGS
ncbi:TadE/TadG family type IV pilus assembly protein [Castellaniella sp.]|uniref:TadE/TadG family type IV pilus assembly protein n=1 Tax=Castellaniella sp. TaxID=1955812 RepID=UPI003C75CD13